MNAVIKITKRNTESKNNSLLMEKKHAIIANQTKTGPKLLNSPIITKDGKYLIIKMEKMDGTLKSFIQNKSVSKCNKLDIIQEVSILVQKLHNLNICHGDLHIKNIMYKKLPNNKFIVRLIDFGKSKSSCTGSLKNNNMMAILKMKFNVQKLKSPRKRIQTIRHNSPSPKKYPAWSSPNSPSPKKYPAWSSPNSPSPRRRTYQLSSYNSPPSKGKQLMF